MSSVEKSLLTRRRTHGDSVGIPVIQLLFFWSDSLAVLRVASSRRPLGDVFRVGCGFVVRIEGCFEAQARRVARV